MMLALVAMTAAAAGGPPLPPGLEGRFDALERKFERELEQVRIELARMEARLDSYEAESTVEGRRRAQDTASCVAQAAAVTTACPSGSRHRLLQDGLPSECSLTCAPAFIAFREECADMMVKAGFDMVEVERLNEACLSATAVDQGSCGEQLGRRILQRTNDAAGTAGATAAMIIPLTITRDARTGMLVALSQTGRRRQLQGGAETVQEYRCACGDDIAACLPVCGESLHGYELLATIDETDIRMSCKLNRGMFSWAGAVSEGSYFGEDHELFLNVLISGAAGHFLLQLLENPGVTTDTLVQRNQVVKINGRRSTTAHAWGTGGFSVQQGGSLSLIYLKLDIVSSAFDCVSSSAGLPSLPACCLSSL